MRRKKDGKFFQGFEILYHEAQMTFKATVLTLAGLCIMYGFFTFLIYDHLLGQKYPFMLHIKFLISWLVLFLGELVFKIFEDRIAFLSPYLFPYLSKAWDFVQFYKQSVYPGVRDFFLYCLVASPFALGASFYVVRKIFKRVARKRIHDPKYIRGAKLIKPRELAKQLKKEGNARIRLTKHLYLPVGAENEHIAIFGASGVGKSVLIKSILSQLRGYDDVCIIFDLKGEYVSTFHQLNDLIFNPVDARSVHWNIFSDIKNIDEIPVIARAFIPKGEGKETYFNEAAKQILVAILKILWQKGNHSWTALWEVISEGLADPKKLLNFLIENKSLIGSTGISHISRLDSGQTQGVISTLENYTSVFELMARNFPGEGGISLRDWLKNAKGSWLFLPVPAEYEETIAPLFTAVVSLLIRQVKAFPDYYPRKTWFILDELGNLLEIPKLSDLLAIIRSKNGCVLLGTQTVAKLDKKYSPEERKDIVNNCATKLIFRLEDPETAKFASELFGDQEIEEGSHSYQMGVMDVRDGMGYARQNVIKPVVLDSEIRALKKFQCFVKILNFNPTRDEIIFRKFNPKTEAFVYRENTLTTSTTGGITYSEEQGRREEVAKSVSEKRQEQEKQKKIEQVNQKEHKQELSNRVMEETNIAISEPQSDKEHGIEY